MRVKMKGTRKNVLRHDDLGEEHDQKIGHQSRVAQWWD
jgi:hypothetical protein